MWVGPGWAGGSGAVLLVQVDDGGTPLSPVQSKAVNTFFGGGLSLDVPSNETALVRRLLTRRANAVSKIDGTTRSMVGLNL